MSFARFIAEALSTLDFKRLEEPMAIIKHLNASLAVSGLQVLHHLQGGIGGGGLLAGDMSALDSVNGAVSVSHVPFVPLALGSADAAVHRSSSGYGQRNLCSGPRLVQSLSARM